MEQPETVGRYQVERLIAHGGMGSLYLARDPVIDRPIVIKFLKVGFDDSGARERFAREARAAGRLHHPNIVTVFDVGEHENRPFIAMEYVAGETLAQLIARRGVRRLWEKLLIIEEVCAGLHYAHSAAIIHRDIKPSNVMRDQSGVVKILDFGIARGAGGAVTEVGDIVGTLNYMSPEQLAGEDVDHRTDIYSVGVLAYELITDQMAFPGTIQTGVLFKILNSAALPIESLIPGIDPDIPAVIARAIARDPEGRYANLEALRQDLAVVRTRLLEAAGDDDFEDAADPDAETRILLPRPSSGLLTPQSSRAGSTLPSARKTAPLPAGPPRRPRTAGVLVAVAGTLALALAGSWVFGWLPLTGPQSSSISEGSGPAPQPSASVPAPTPAPTTSQSAPATEPAASVPPQSAAPVSAKAKAPASPSSKEEQVPGRGPRSPAAPPAAPLSAS
ncbi:MAG TPA: protein kinase, partial [Vicinamibacterales bacterium]|nr:protein kinase [Vicinamibacterales bacterium]